MHTPLTDFDPAWTYELGEEITWGQALRGLLIPDVATTFLGASSMLFAIVFAAARVCFSNVGRVA